MAGENINVEVSFSTEVNGQKVTVEDEIEHNILSCRGCTVWPNFRKPGIEIEKCREHKESAEGLVYFEE